MTSFCAAEISEWILDRLALRASRIGGIMLRCRVIWLDGNRFQRR